MLIKLLRYRFQLALQGSLPKGQTKPTWPRNCDFHTIRKLGIRRPLGLLLVQGHVPLPVSLGAGHHCLHCWFRNTPPGPKSRNQEAGSNIGSRAWFAGYICTSKTNLSLPISLRVESGSCPSTSSKESGNIIIFPASTVQEGMMDRGWSGCWANTSISKVVVYMVESWEDISFLFSVKLVFVCWWKE